MGLDHFGMLSWCRNYSIIGIRIPTTYANYKELLKKIEPIRMANQTTNEELLSCPENTQSTGLIIHNKLCHKGLDNSVCLKCNHDYFVCLSNKCEIAVDSVSVKDVVKENSEYLFNFSLVEQHKIDACLKNTPNNSESGLTAWQYHLIITEYCIDVFSGSLNNAKGNK